LVLRVCRSAGKGLFALWLLGDVKLPHAPENKGAPETKAALDFHTFPSHPQLGLPTFSDHRKSFRESLALQWIYTNIISPQEQTGISYSHVSMFSESFSEDYS